MVLFWKLHPSRVCVCVTACMGMILAWNLTPATRAQTLWEEFDPCTAHNNYQSAEATYVGEITQLPYTVVIPGDSPEDLAFVRQCISDALILKGSRGHYIQAGSFASRIEADYLARILRTQGLDARVIYTR